MWFAALLGCTALTPAPLAAQPPRLEPASGAVPWRETAAPYETRRINACADTTSAAARLAPTPLLTTAATLLSLLLGFVVLRRRRREQLSLAGQALSEARAQLGATDQRIAAFLAILAHELRNPLAPIRSAAELMRHLDSGSEPRLTRARAIIDRQVMHLARLLDELLDTARVSHNVVALRPTSVAVADIVGDAIELSTDAIARGAHDLVVRHRERGVRVRGDRLRLGQVIAALLDNAARFTPAGGHIVVSTGRDNGSAQISVRDDGIGIARAAQGRIFELFAREGATFAHAGGEGLGIGLALVRQLVVLHGGSVEVESTPGRGSTFRVRLPLAEA